MIKDKFYSVSYIFSMVGVITLLLSSISIAATYDSATRELRLPAVFDGEKTYINAVLTLNDNGTYSLTGDESSLPFRCTNNFSENTLDLLNDGMSVSDVELLLGCGWSAHIIIPISGSTSNGYTWYDTQCSELNINFNSNGNLLGKGDLAFVSNCPLAEISADNFDLTRERLLLSTVVVDEVSIANSTIIKFDVSNKTWELISTEILSRGQPSYICDLITEDIFTNKILPAKTLIEVENILGCQWSARRADDSSNINSWTFVDHECGFLNIAGKDQSEITVSTFWYPRAGCVF